MPFTNRQREVEGNYVANRRMFRTVPDLKRVAKNSNGRQKPAPPESTNAESFYYVK
jgi:hypothetical protein